MAKFSKGSSKGSKGSKGNSKKDIQKKKGPKGKKAREKAKLDRQWGERISPTVPVVIKRPNNTSKNTILRESSMNNNTDNDKNDDRMKVVDAHHANRNREMMSSTIDDDDDDDDDEEKDDDNNTSTTMSTPLFYTKLMQTIQNTATTGTARSAKIQHRSRKSDHNYDGDDDDDEMDMDMDDTFDDDTDDDDDDDDKLRYDAFADVIPIDIENDKDDVVVDAIHHSVTTTTTTTSTNVVDGFQQKYVNYDVDSVVIPTLINPTTSTSMINQMQHPTTTSSTSFVSVAPIQDNTNIRIHVTPSSLLDQWYFHSWGNYSKEMTNAPNTRTTSTTIISKRQLQSGAELCRWNMSYIGTYTNRHIFISSLNKYMTKQQQQQQQRHCHQYVIPTVVLPAVCCYTDTLITTDGLDYGHYSTRNKNHLDSIEYGILDRMQQLHTMIGMHIMNHIVASRYNIQAHNKKLSKQKHNDQDKNEYNNDDGDDDDNRNHKQEKLPGMNVDDDNEKNDKSDDNITTNNTNHPSQQPLRQIPTKVEVDWQRDQGFTRPTVLVLLPTRNCCFDFVQTLLSILYYNHQNESSSIAETTNTTTGKKKKDRTNITGSSTSKRKLNGTTSHDDHQSSTTPSPSYGSNVDHWDRFVVEYGPIPDTVQTSIDETLKLSKHRQSVLRQKGTLWNELFGDHRNDDDDYKIGLQINVKKYGTKHDSSSSSSSKDATTKDTFQGSVKLYSDFYRSDIIIASPLGLKMAVANKKNDEDDDNDDDKKDKKISKSQDSSTDFLSSIEICMIGRGDVLLQQNWDHVTDILRQLNHIPKSMNMTDFSRVRPYFLSGQAHLWRQLIICSTHSDPMLTSCFKRYGTSQSGSIKITRQYDVEEASLHAVRLPITRQVFQRVSTTSTFMNAGSDRVQYFCKYLWPEIEKQKQKHTLIFIPSYFDFVMLRNILLQRKEDGIALIDFVSVTEYSRITEVSRGRARFLQGRKEVMLYTGRAHYFLRHAIKGVRHLIFLGVPEQASFYSEHVNRLNEGLPSSLDETTNDDTTSGIQSSTCLTLFTKYDSYALERIVGTTNCSRMVKGEKSTYYFSS